MSKLSFRIYEHLHGLFSVTLQLFSLWIAHTNKTFGYRKESAWRTVSVEIFAESFNGEGEAISHVRLYVSTLSVKPSVLHVYGSRP